MTIRNVQPANVGSYAAQVRNRFSRAVESLPAFLELGSNTGGLAQDKLADLLAFGSLESARQTVFRRKKAFVSVSAGAIGSHLLSNFGAALELKEPIHGGDSINGASKWQELTTEADGILQIDTSGSDVNTLLAVYTGTNLLNLVLVAEDNNRGFDRVSSLVRFKAARNTKYLIAVDTVNGARGKIQLNWKLGVPPSIVESDPPLSQPIPLGEMITLRATPAGIPTPVIQWQLDGMNLIGETNSVLSLTNVHLSHAGTYSAVVSNLMGTVTNAVAGFWGIVNWERRRDGIFRLQVNRGRATKLEIEASSDLNQWQTLFTHTVRGGVLDLFSGEREPLHFEFNDLPSTNFPRRFYRIRSTK